MDPFFLLRFAHLIGLMLMSAIAEARGKESHGIWPRHAARSAGQWLIVRNEARLIPANITKLPELLGRKD